MLEFLEGKVTSEELTQIDRKASGKRVLSPRANHHDFYRYEVNVDCIDGGSPIRQGQGVQRD